MTIERALRAAIDGEVRFDALTRALYATDASVYHITPLGVVIPKSVDDVVTTVRLCREAGVSITARGGGTSQAGQAIGAGVVVDTSKYLNKIIEIDEASRWARVEPGVVLDDLNTMLERRGVRFAPDVSSSSRATLGGMMANNSSGARSIVYGKTIDHVIEQDVVLADGQLAHLSPLSGHALTAAETGHTILGSAYRKVPALARAHAAEIARRFPKVLRRVGGYNLDAFIDPSVPVDLTRMMVGSEGTLGLVTEARIKLVPLPKARGLLTVEFAHVLDALAATPTILEHGPTAVEVMDAFILQHTRSVPLLDATRRAVCSDEGGALLCIEFAGATRDAVEAPIAALEQSLTRGFTCRLTRTFDAAEQRHIWHLRESALGLATAMKGDAKSISFVEDTAVPPERLRDYIARFLSILERHDTVAGIYAHASVGCLHVRPVINLKTADGVRKFEAIAHEVADLVLEFGGALSGEHGDGIVRGPFTEKMFGPTLYGAFREVKRIFDPDSLFNPGKIVDSPPLTNNLRFGPTYDTPAPATWFEYAADGGFGRAVEMCSGVGACRKLRGGTMCPSFRATRDEQHSTRGRANVLRLAMTGQLGADDHSDQAVRDALDLCLECRACKSECPTGVDMERFKSEFLAGYWSRHGVSRQALAFGRAPQAARWGSRLAPVVNALAERSVGRRLGEALLGIDRRRPLPTWTRRPFSGRHPTRFSTNDAAPPDVLLFADTFTEYSEPEIGDAAFRVLESLGTRVRVAPYECCGRPLISQGLLAEAKALAATNASRLIDAVDRGASVVVLEPSCLSALREDAPALLSGDDRAKAERVAARTLSFEQYVERRLKHQGSALRFTAIPTPRIVLHAHCHQRAMGLASEATALLSRLPGAMVTDLDAGCCGMAGSFGYTREHYEVSRAIGELGVLPAARALGPDGVMVASGTSCRHQVAHFAGVQALHPAILLRSLLESS